MSSHETIMWTLIKYLLESLTLRWVSLGYHSIHLGLREEEIVINFFDIPDDIWDDLIPECRKLQNLISIYNKKMFYSHSFLKTSPDIYPFIGFNMEGFIEHDDPLELIPIIQTSQTKIKRDLQKELCDWAQDRMSEEDLLLFKLKINAAL